MIALVLAFCMFTANDQFMCTKSTGDTYSTVAACEKARVELPKATFERRKEEDKAEIDITEYVAFSRCITNGDEAARAKAIMEIEAELHPELLKRQAEALERLKARIPAPGKPI